MLAIEVRFLTGRYVATAYNNRSEAEWPPHPARLFSALVATHFQSPASDAGEAAVLQWLETLGPPAIRASDASAREVVTVFVPVNDTAMTKCDDEAAALDETIEALTAARDRGEPAKQIVRAEKAVATARARLDAAIQRDTSPPKKDIDPRGALAVLPGDTRVRQPRTFPSVTPDDPRVVFVWPEASPSREQAATLDALLARLVRLGHSSSLVAARLIDEPVEPDWRPTGDREIVLRVAEAGQFDALQAAFERHRETEPRVLPARFQGYSRTKRVVDEPLDASCFADDWLVLRRVGGPSVPMIATANVARTFRRALMAHAEEPIHPTISGHATGGGPSDEDHLAVVPLPFVGHAHAHGGILGIAVVLPRSADDDARRAVYRAVARWESAHREEDEDTPRVPLTLGSAGVLELQRIEWAASQRTLRPATWCSPAKTWSSVTPVALDRNPGNLRSRDPAELAAAVDAAAQSIRAACRRIGVGEPECVEILPAAPWTGSAKARSYPPFPQVADRVQRVLTHARIRFQRPVFGPLLLGAGRYSGLGLFRPEADHG